MSATGPISAIFDIEHQTMTAARRQQLRMEAALLVFECYAQVLNKLEDDAEAASQVFEFTAKTLKKMLVPRKGRGQGKKNTVLNDQLRRAHDTAPPRRKKGAVADVVGGLDDSAARQARRLTAAEREADKLLTAAADAIRSGNQSGARKLFVEALLSGKPTAEKQLMRHRLRIIADK